MKMNKFIGHCLSRRFGVQIVSALITYCMVFVSLLLPVEMRAAVPVSGSIASTGPVAPFAGTWAGNLTGTPPAANGEPSCIDPVGTAGNCDNFVLTVTGTAASWSGKRIRVNFNWTLASTDYDMVVRKESNGVPGLQGDGVTPATPLDDVIGTSGNGTNTNEECVISPSETGVGDYYIRAIYYVANPADQYQGSVTIFNVSTSLPTGTLITPTFDNYQPPVDFPRRDDSPEPSVGVNWNTGNIMSMSRLQCDRTSFNDITSPVDPVNGTIWFHQTSQAIVTGLDPILFTDSITGRTICGELVGAGGATDGIISDDDLTTATATFQTGATNGQDHQTIGGGPPKKGITGRQPTGTYPHLMYYASQAIATATVATSLDGGLTYLPAVPAYTLLQCGGLHGHIKVAPDGTVYLPNKGCGNKVGLAVSEDNGLNWSLRTIPTSTSGANDPSIGIGSGGRLFVGYTASDNHPHVAVSDDKGLTWRDDFDLALGIMPNIRAAVFPQAVAGDNDRAAIFFLGTNSTNAGDPVGTDNGGAGPNFAGTWYPYIAVTNDAGRSWKVIRADNDPLHPGVLNPAQQGVVCTNGTTCPGPPTVPVDTRNLADFNEISVDAAGRIIAVYADGCNFDNPCINITDNSGTRIENQGVARLTLIRQRGGTRLFREFDAGSPSIPLAPFVNVNSLQDQGNALIWGTPDDRGSKILKYRIYMGAKGQRERLIATIRVGTNRFIDRKGRSDHYYHVTAVNKYGESRKIAKSFVSKAGS
jgi:hypothetical protein